MQRSKLKWDQSKFDKFQAGFGRWRRSRDQRQLQKIFDLAEEVPLLKQALDWAEQHGVKFFVDHTVANCSAYYTNGTGVIGIAQKSFVHTSHAVGTLVHEIRHAWQDYHGLLLSPESARDFATYFMQLALVEADASAFGKRAAAEYESLYPGQKIWLAPNRRQDLQHTFLSWFTMPDVVVYYGVGAVQDYRRIIEGGASSTDRYEFDHDIPSVGTGVNLDHLDSVLSLGKTFSGDNYLASLPYDFLPRKILSPALAMIFYGSATAAQKKEVAALRKRELKDHGLPMSKGFK